MNKKNLMCLVIVLSILLVAVSCSKKKASLPSSPVDQNTATITNTYTATAVFSPTSTGTFTSTATQSQTSTYTATPVATGTSTLSGTPTFTSTSSPTVETATPTFTSSNTPTYTETATQTFTSSITPTNTETATQTFTSSNTLTNTETATETFTFSPTPTGTRTFTPTTTPTKFVKIIDDFNDGDMVNECGGTWESYSSNGWAAAPVATEGVTGYAIKVTGSVTSSGGGSGWHTGMMGVPSNTASVNMPLVNFLNVTIKVVKNIPGGNVNDFRNIYVQINGTSALALALIADNYIGNGWITYKFDLNGLMYAIGDKNLLFSSVTRIDFEVQYAGTAIETAECEVYIDDIYFSED